MNKLDYLLELISDYTGYTDEESREINHAIKDAKKELEHLRMMAGITTPDANRFLVLAAFLDPNTYIYGSHTPVDYLEECGDSELYALRKCVDAIEEEQKESKRIKEFQAKEFNY